MEVTNQIYAEPDQRARYSEEGGPAGPIYMVNLLKFRDKAVYPDGRPTELSGRDAFRLYGMLVGKLMSGYGGRPVFAANVTGLSLGVVEELWDEVAIAMYPDRAALVAMSASDEWKAAAIHREAGLVGQVNIETTLLPGLKINWKIGPA